MIRIETLIAAAMRFPEVMGPLGEALQSDLVVPNPFYRQVIGFYSTFWAKSRSFPKSGDVEYWMSTLPVQQQAGIREAWSRLSMENLSNYSPNFLAEHTVEDLRLAATKTALSRLNQITDLKPDALQVLSEQIAKIEPAVLDLVDIREPARWVYTETVDSYIPTGIRSVDRYIGGWSEELVFILADSGVGKSTFLVNTAQHACLLGFSVLYVTLELSKEKTAHRVYRRITETTLPEYRKDPGKVVRDAEHWLKYARGQLHIHYEPAYSLTPAGLRNIVDRYVQKYGEIHLVVLDYLDLMVSSHKGRDSNQYQDMAFITHETRALCPDYRIPVVSATQATRQKGRKKLQLTDMSESYGKVRGAGIVASISQTDDEVKEMQARFGLLKVRDNPGRGIEVPLFVDLDLMLMADLDDPNTRAIIRRRHPKLLEKQKIDDTANDAGSN